MKYMTFLFTGISVITMIFCLVLMFTEPKDIEFATYVFILAGVLGTVSLLTNNKR
jgi:lipoprotein signal peptidase